MKQRHKIHDKTDTQSGYMGRVPIIGNDLIIASHWQKLENPEFGKIINNINTIQNIMNYSATLKRFQELRTQNDKDATDSINLLLLLSDLKRMNPQFTLR